MTSSFYTGDLEARLAELTEARAAYPHIPAELFDSMERLLRTIDELDRLEDSSTTGPVRPNRPA